MKITDISVTEAEKALEQLHAATGIDLRGYGHIFGVDDHVLEERLGRLGDGEIAFLLGDAWVKVPRPRSLSVEHKQDMVDVTQFGSRIPRVVAGLKSIEISLEIDWDDVMSPALLDKLREYEKTLMRMGANGQILSADVYFRSYETEIGHHGIATRFEMTVSGEMAVN